MSQRYSKPQTEQEKEQLMGKRKVTTETKVKRASVSRERRLALALRAVLDATENMVLTSSTDEPLSFAAIDATAVLNELGYGSMIGIPKRLAELNDALKIAVENSDGKEIARLGLELDRVQAGKVSRVVSEKAKDE